MTIFRKQNGFKQFLTLLVVFTLICPGALSAKKEKHGAWLKVTMQDAQVLEGELLKVSDSDILLMSNSETGIKIPLTEIKMVEYKKKGKFGTGFAFGFGLTTLVALIGNLGGHCGGGRYEFGYSLLTGIVIGLPLGSCFGLAESQSVRKKTHNFQNLSPQEFSKNLEKLKTMARF